MTTMAVTRGSTLLLSSLERMYLIRQPTRGLVLRCCLSKSTPQVAILMGCAILPHLRNLVEIIEHGLVDEQQKVRTITALAIAALAEAATPYGIESFDSVLKPLWKGIR